MQMMTEAIEVAQKPETEEEYRVRRNSNIKWLSTIGESGHGDWVKSSKN